MFRKYNKKIITAVLVLIVTVGLIGPGVLLIFQGFYPTDYSDHNAQVLDQIVEENVPQVPLVLSASSSATETE